MDYIFFFLLLSYFLIGGLKYSGVKSYKLSFILLLSNFFFLMFYYIGIDSVFVNNVKLYMSFLVWVIDELGNGGIVVDLGMILIFVMELVYCIMLVMVDWFVKLFKLVELILGFDLCFNVLNELSLSFLSLSFKFVGGLLFVLLFWNYFIDVVDGVKCLVL